MEMMSMHGPSKGYGKHSKLFWAMVYLLIAALVYGLIFWFFVRNTGAGGSIINY